MPKFKTPTKEELKEYDDMVQEIIDAREAGENTTAREADLKEFQIKTGIANEMPSTDFPELMNPTGDQ